MSVRHWVSLENCQWETDLSRSVFFVHSQLHSKCTFLHPKAVERNSCEAKSEGLVRYPTTLAPVSGSVNVATECADNAHTTGTSLNVLCSSSVDWSGDPQCQCDTGYHSATANGRQICQGPYFIYIPSTQCHQLFKAIQYVRLRVRV